MTVEGKMLRVQLTLIEVMWTMYTQPIYVSQKRKNNIKIMKIRHS